MLWVRKVWIQSQQNNPGNILCTQVEPAIVKKDKMLHPKGHCNFSVTEVNAHEFSLTQEIKVSAKAKYTSESSHPHRATVTERR